MKRLLLLAVLAPALAGAQFQVQAGATFTLELPVIIPPLVVIQPGIEVVPDVDFEVFHADGYYWTQRDGRWYRSSNPRSGWVHHPRGYPPGLAKMKPGKYKRWKGPPAGRAPAYRGDDGHEGHHDDDHGDKHGGKGKGGKGHGKH